LADPYKILRGTARTEVVGPGLLDPHLPGGAVVE
jgi:hypothetical protein